MASNDTIVIISMCHLITEHFVVYIEYSSILELLLNCSECSVCICKT